MANDNYDMVTGVGYSRWSNDDEDATEPVTEQNDAAIEEMYYSHGQVKLTLETEDGFLSIDLPVKSREDWNLFVGSLPMWE